MASLSAMYRYPLKSGMAEPLNRVRVDELGLQGDRRWMLVDSASGRFLTQRALPRMTQLLARASATGGLTLTAPHLPPLDVPLPGADAELRGVTIWNDSLRVPDAGDDAARWLGEFVGKPTRLVQVPAERARHTAAGFGLDTDRVAFADGFPILLIGQASLDDLSSRVGQPLEMLRFRPNLVVEGFDAYAEDQWTQVRIGDAIFRVVKACSRCILTTLDPVTGERHADREPLATLKTYREKDGDVFFGQNLVLDGAGHLEVGMPVTVVK